MAGDRVCEFCIRQITQAGEMYELPRIDGLDKKFDSCSPRYCSWIVYILVALCDLDGRTGKYLQIGGFIRPDAKVAP
jgi:hypothetical protein